MNVIAYGVAVAALGLMSGASAYAQTQRIEPALPQGVQELRVEPSGELAPPASAPIAPRLVQNAARAQHDADARHCLSATTNKAIHRCAERYRGHRARVSVRKSSAKRAAVRPARRAEVTRSPEIVRPGAPNPADPAKAAELVKPMDLTKSSAASRTTGKAPDAGKAAPTAPPPVKTAPPAPGAKQTR